MAFPLPTGAILAASTRDPVIVCPREHWLVATLAYAIHLASQFQQLLSGALMPLIYRFSELLNLARLTSVSTSPAVRGLLYHTIRLSGRATCGLWNSKHARRLRKKIEFEFFTLILGGGGNNLCLVIFWPGWGILALGAFAISAWCAK